MGSIGNKRRLGLHVSVSEPTLLNDPEAIFKKAQKDGMVDKNGKLDVEAFIRKNYPEISLIKKPLSSDVSGELKRTDGKWIMLVNTNHPYTRQRYTMSHELGHYVYHRHDKEKFKDSLFFRKKGEKDTLEYKADEFAANILMPETFVEKAVNKGITSIDTLADMFGVSGQAMEKRLTELGYNING